MGFNKLCINSTNYDFSDTTEINKEKQRAVVVIFHHIRKYKRKLFGADPQKFLNMNSTYTSKEETIYSRHNKSYTETLPPFNSGVKDGKLKIALPSPKKNAGWVCDKVDSGDIEEKMALLNRLKEKFEKVKENMKYDRLATLKLQVSELHYRDVKRRLSKMTTGNVGVKRNNPEYNKKLGTCISRRSFSVDSINFNVDGDSNDVDDIEINRTRSLTDIIAVVNQYTKQCDNFETKYVQISTAALDNEPSNMSICRNTQTNEGIGNIYFSEYIEYHKKIHQNCQTKLCEYPTKDGFTSYANKLHFNIKDPIIMKRVFGSTFNAWQLNNGRDPIEPIHGEVNYYYNKDITKNSIEKGKKQITDKTDNEKNGLKKDYMSKKFPDDKDGNTVRTKFPTKDCGTSEEVLNTSKNESFVNITNSRKETKNKFDLVKNINSNENISCTSESSVFNSMLKSNLIKQNSKINETKIDQSSITNNEVLNKCDSITKQKTTSFKKNSLKALPIDHPKINICNDSFLCTNVNKVSIKKGKVPRERSKAIKRSFCENTLDSSDEGFDSKSKYGNEFLKEKKNLKRNLIQSSDENNFVVRNNKFRKSDKSSLYLDSSSDDADISVSDSDLDKYLKDTIKMDKNNLERPPILRNLKVSLKRIDGYSNKDMGIKNPKSLVQTIRKPKYKYNILPADIDNEDKNSCLDRRSKTPKSDVMNPSTAEYENLSLPVVRMRKSEYLLSSDSNVNECAITTTRALDENDFSKIYNRDIYVRENPKKLGTINEHKGLRNAIILKDDKRNAENNTANLRKLAVLSPKSDKVIKMKQPDRENNLTSNKQITVQHKLETFEKQRQLLQTIDENICQKNTFENISKDSKTGVIILQNVPLQIMNTKDKFVPKKQKEIDNWKSTTSVFEKVASLSNPTSQQKDCIKHESLHKDSNMPLQIDLENLILSKEQNTAEVPRLKISSHNKICNQKNVHQQYPNTSTEKYKCFRTVLSNKNPSTAKSVTNETSDIIVISDDEEICASKRNNRSPNISVDISEVNRLNVIDCDVEIIRNPVDCDVQTAGDTINCDVSAVVNIVDSDVETITKTKDSYVHAVVNCANVNLQTNSILCPEIATRTVNSKSVRISTTAIRTVNMEVFIEELLPLYISYYYQLVYLKTYVKTQYAELIPNTKNISHIFNTIKLFKDHLSKTLVEITDMINTVEIQNFNFYEFMTILNSGFIRDLKIHSFILFQIFGRSRSLTSNFSKIIFVYLCETYRLWNDDKDLFYYAIRKLAYRQQPNNVMTAEQTNILGLQQINSLQNMNSETKNYNLRYNNPEEKEGTSVNPANENGENRIRPTTENQIPFLVNNAHSFAARAQHNLSTVNTEEINLINLLKSNDVPSLEDFPKLPMTPQTLQDLLISEIHRRQEMLKQFDPDILEY